uniref:Uncharacterized protein n=1 Tax=Cruciviridae sp. TaxID=1955495 RepID=A0A1S6LVK1_9VIRU|nr:hypothetical protein [Cruciviridae sp.]
MLLRGHSEEDCGARCEHGCKPPCCASEKELCDICEPMIDVCECEVGEFCDICDPPM